MARSLVHSGFKGQSLSKELGWKHTCCTLRIHERQNSALLISNARRHTSENGPVRHITCSHCRSHHHHMFLLPLSVLVKVHITSHLLLHLGGAEPSLVAALPVCL